MGRGGRTSVHSASPVSIRQRVQGRTPERSLQWAAELGDGLGRGLDAGSVRPIAALHLLGIETSASCDGHDDHGQAFPWIDVTREEDGRWLLQHLPSWHMVQRGQGEKRSYRLNPKEIQTIDDTSADHLPRSYWDPARRELERFADSVLRG